MNKTELKQIITKAFDGVSYPQNITLHVAQVHDSYDYDNDAKWKQLDYIGRWQDIPNEHITRCCNALSYLEPDGLRYYLPAFMIWVIDNWENFEEVSWSHDATILTFHVHKDFEDHKTNQFSLFNDQQYHACACFLKFCIEKEDAYMDDIVKCLERRWSKMYKFLNMLLDKEIR